MRLKIEVDRQDKIEYFVLWADKTKSKVCQDKIENHFPFCLVGQNRENAEFV